MLRTTFGRFLCAVVAGAAVFGGTARAAVPIEVGSPPTLTILPGDVLIDEAGNGSYLPPAGGAIITLPATNTIVDPGPGALPGALSYTLPFNVDFSGDLLLTEPGTTGVVSDVVRFIGNHIFFYPDPPADEPADIGLPTAVQNLNMPLEEIGPEDGINGINYTPLAGMPGYAANSVVTYHIISDTPEPASLALVALGGLTLLARRRRS
jgi:hypothetical protein